MVAGTVEYFRGRSSRGFPPYLTTNEALPGVKARL